MVPSLSRGWGARGRELDGNGEAHWAMVNYMHASLDGLGVCGPGGNAKFVVHDGAWKGDVVDPAVSAVSNKTRRGVPKSGCHRQAPAPNEFIKEHSSKP